ncbi:MAG: signal peptidase I [Candidatus Bathyarchaeota archaeon]|nr:signal peptidase I [Candidatus Bathyarchaeota archaeon]
MAADYTKYKNYLILDKIKRICLFFVPFLLGFAALQSVLDIDEPLVVSSGRSMQPTINEGDILVFKGITAEEVAIGDIVLFEVPDYMIELLPPKITHRVTEIRQDSDGYYFRTKGDNAPLDTYEIPGDKILGKNVAVIPFIGLPILKAQTPVGISVVVLMVVASQMRRYMI